MKKLAKLVPAVLLAMAMLASEPVGANAAVSVVGRIDGGGTSQMDAGAPLQGGSSFSLGVTLMSDGSARGEFHCVDFQGDTLAGNIFGEITRWSKNADGSVTLYGSAKLVFIPGGPVVNDLPFSVTIQHFGGAGVGHWTLDALGRTVCFETLISGQIVARWN